MLDSLGAIEYGGDGVADVVAALGNNGRQARRNHLDVYSIESGRPWITFGHESLRCEKAWLIVVCQWAFKTTVVQVSELLAGHWRSELALSTMRSYLGMAFCLFLVRFRGRKLSRIMTLRPTSYHSILLPSLRFSRRQQCR